MKGQHVVKLTRIIDCDISIVTMETTKSIVMDALEKGSGGYVCFSNVHTVVEAHKDIALRDATNNALVAAPDGKPLSVLARWRGVEGIERVAGPDFFTYLMEMAPGLRHYFMGSTDATLELLVANVQEGIPGINICGTYSPPFGPMEGAISEEIIKRIKDAQPDIIWVGLGAPKQEIWMAKNYVALAPALLFGVGAAFDFHAGTIIRAPKWMSKIGLEWLYRFLSEPRRLWRRYLLTNTFFLIWVVKSWFKGPDRPV